MIYQQDAFLTFYSANCHTLGSQALASSLSDFAGLWMPSLGCCCNFKARVNCRRLHLSWFKLRILSFLTHRDWCFTCLLKELRQHFIQSESLTGPFVRPGLWNFTCILQHLQPNGWDRVALLFARLDVFEKAGSCLALDGFGEDRVWGCFTARASAVWLWVWNAWLRKQGAQ